MSQRHVRKRAQKEFTKRFAFVLFISFFLQLEGAVKSGLQQNKQCNEIPQIIKENTVVFLSISPEDYEKLGPKDPEAEEGIGELLSDYLYYTEQLGPKLEQLGIRVIFSMSKVVSFQMSDGKTIKITFDPKDVCAMAMYAKGQEPKLVSGFGSGVRIRTNISEYFHIKIER